MSDEFHLAEQVESYVSTFQNRMEATDGMKEKWKLPTYLPTYLPLFKLNWSFY